MSVKTESKDKCINCGHPRDMHRERGCIFIGSESDLPNNEPITICQCKKLITVLPKG